MTRVSLAATVIVAACNGRPVTRADCDKLLDSYVEKRVFADDLQASASDVERLRVEARARATKNATFQECPRKVSRAAMDCALAAYNADEIERCLVPIPLRRVAFSKERQRPRA